MRWVLVLAAGAGAAHLAGGGAAGRLIGAVVREVARVVT